jgi:hypothetical protein
VSGRGGPADEGPGRARNGARRALVERVDHLVLAAPDLDEGVDVVEALLGARAAPGGRHPGWGTRNALLSLGTRCYLEIVGPDPERSGGGPPTVFGISGLTAPRLVTWAAREGDLEEAFRRAVARGVPLGTVSAGERERPTGESLSWRLTDPEAVVADGVVPFLIDWGSTAGHPALDAPPAGRLVELRGEHPDPDPVRALLRALELPLEVAAGPRPALVAVVETARGRVELR